MFDVSHLGKLAITGPGAAEFVNRCFTADLGKIGPGHAQYTLCCTPSGGVRRRHDRLPRSGPTRCWPCPTPPTPPRVAELLRAAAPAGVEVTDRHRDLAVLAVQGPRPVLFATVFPGSRRPTWTTWRSPTPGRHRACLPHRLHRRARLRAARARGRGGRGVGRAARRGGRWAGARAASAPATPCAPRWATRCTARTSRSTSPRCRRAAAGRSAGPSRSSGAVTRWSRRRRPGPARRLRGLRATGRGVPRPGMAVLQDGARGRRHHVGHVLPDAEGGHRAGAARHGRGGGRGVAVTYEAVAVDVRGRSLECAVVKPPFRAVARAAERRNGVRDDWTSDHGAPLYRLGMSAQFTRTPNPAPRRRAARRRSSPTPDSAGTSPTTW